MTRSFAQRLSTRLSILIATVFGLFLAAVPAQAVEHLAKPRYRGRTYGGGGGALPLWLVIVLLVILVIVLIVVAKNRSAAKAH